jgi:hypothetical protein
MSSAALRRASHRQLVLKPQDFAVLLKLFVQQGLQGSYASLAKSMQLSAFEAHAAVQRLLVAGLVVERGYASAQAIAVVRPALKEFMLYGAPYAFPATLGEITIGVPTAHGAAPLNQKVLFSGHMPPVWPDAEGDTRGQALLPLYEKLPAAARLDHDLYELLALFDGLRIGQARERELARQLIEAKLNDR